MDLDLTCVASLLVLYAEEQYGRAARRLKLTPSALTKRVQRLERQVGVELVMRGAGGAVEPTAAGYRFRPAAAQLLRDAETARRAASSTPVRRAGSLVLGVPAGPQIGPLHKILPSVMTEVRANWPGTRLACRPVLFPALTSCLLGGEVDVLWTLAPVLHPAVTSTPVGMTAARVGVLDKRHSLAGADAIDVEEFAGLPLLYNPAVPDEWMSVFYLGDIRPQAEAHLVRAGPRDMAGVAQQAVRHHTGLVALEIFADLVGPRFHTLRLNGIPPIVLHAAYRRREHRGVVHSLIAALTRGQAHLLHQPGS